MTLPNYNLSSLEKFNANIFTNAAPEESGFIIALSAFYNDMKELYWFYDILAQNKPANITEISAYNGQYR